MADDLKSDDFDATAFDASDDEAFAKFLEDGPDDAEKEITSEASDPAALEQETPSEEISPDTEREEAFDASEAEAAKDHPSQNIPPHVVQKERRKRQEAEARAADLEDRLAKLEAAAAPKEPEPEPAPAPPADPVLDPEGFAAQQQAERDTLLARVEANEQAQQQQQQYQQLAAVVGADVQRARAEGPTYDSALEFARHSRASELRALHPTATDEQIQQQVYTDELSLAQSAVQQGQSPSERMIAWASARGFQSQPVAAPKAQIPPEEARARNQTLGGKSGTKEPSNPLAKMGYDEIGELSDKEFEEKIARMAAG